MKKNIDIYIDGPSEDEMKSMANEGIKGYTFNPSLFKNLGVKDYLEHSKKVIDLSQGLPISLEVIGDSHNELIEQAIKLSNLSENVFVKVPITFTNKESTLTTIEELVKEGIKLNITAIFTAAQIEKILNAVKNAEAILSVFAGRLYDIGIDAAPRMKEIGELIHKNSNCNLLWASTRMSYDLISAENVGCDIITMNASMYKKLSLFGKTPEDYSLETVKTFYKDARESGFVI